MFFIFGGGTKYMRKEGGSTMSQKCPNCAKESTFHEVVAADYVSFFFIPVYAEEKETQSKIPYYECSNCGEKFGFVGNRFSKKYYAHAMSFFSYLYQLLTAFKNFIFNFQEKSRKKKQVKRIKLELSNMKKALKNDGDNFGERY